MSAEYILRVIRVEGIQWTGSSGSKKPRLYVQVRLGKSTRKTQEIEDPSGSWNELVGLPQTDASQSVSISLFNRISCREEVCLGSLNVQLGELSGKCIDGMIPLTLSPGDRDVGSLILVVYLLSPSNMLLDIKNDVEAASKRALELEHTYTMEQRVSALSGGGEFYKSLWNIAKKLSVFASVMDEISKINPYVNAAWQLTSAVYKAITYQRETDRELADLARAMQDAYRSATDGETLRNKAQNLQGVIAELLSETAECCYFILEYSKRDFFGRMLQMSRPKIDKFTERFNELMRSFDSNIGLHNAFTSSRLCEKVDRISKKVDLIHLKEVLEPYRTDAFSRSTCLQGTREEILITIADWIRSGTKQNVLWLHGVAGSGKSTIASTVVELCFKESLLGAFLIFSLNTITAGQRASIFQTIAFQLAEFNPIIAKHVEDAVKRNPHITKVSAELQFKELLSNPLNASRGEVTSPVVIVLEALDEYGSLEDRRTLMSILKKSFADLPTNFRFLLTSRPEADIAAALSNRQDLVYELALDSGSEDNIRDVHRYIEHQMSLVFTDSRLDKPDDWETYMKRLTKASEGLFVWASTAVRLVEEHPNPLERLEGIVRNSHSLKGLNQLYDSVLKNSGAILEDDASSITHFSQILGLILLSKEPLTDKTIDGILGFSSRNPSRLILSRLRSVLVFAEGEPIRLLHASFAVYLSRTPCPSPCPIHQRSSDCLSSPWFVNLSSQKLFIAMQCFVIMKDALHFNMCNLESSFEHNQNVPNLTKRIQDNIPLHLEYACLHWAHHLRDVPYSHDSQGLQGLTEELRSFSQHRLLYWLEVLSLLSSIKYEYHNMITYLLFSPLADGAAWSEIYNKDVSSFLWDASKLASTFSMTIIESTPHIYVSMIPLMKEQSKVAAHYSQCFVSTVQVDQIGMKWSPMLLKVLEGHTKSVSSVAVSPNGKYVASGSYDGTIRMWDIESGRLVYSPLEVHWFLFDVSLVAFSLDGRYIAGTASGSLDKAVRIWDTESGELDSGPYKSHSDQIHSLAFLPSGTLVAACVDNERIRIWYVKSGQTVEVIGDYTGDFLSIIFSPNGERIISGSTDGTIQVWDTDTGQLIGKPFVGYRHEDSCFAISPDGMHIVSGDFDSYLQVWDIKSGEVIFGPFKHTRHAISVAFSPDGTRIVSGSEEGTVVVHDTQSREIICGPSAGHMDLVCSIAFAPDGSYAVSGSYDKTVRLWDTSIETRHPSVCHTDEIRSVVYSPDGSRIASGSEDGAIGLWDTTTCKPACAPFIGHKNGVNSVAFSPDGRRIVSGSDDGTVIIWDAENKKIDVGPLTEHGDAVTSVNFSPDGTRAASRSADKTIIIWNAVTGEIIHRFRAEHEHWIGTVRFLADGRLIALVSTDSAVILQNVETGEIVSGPFEIDKAGTSLISPLALSLDGKQIASTSRSDSIIVWDVESSSPLTGSSSWGSRICSISFSPDRQHIVSGTASGEVMIWNVNDGTIIPRFYKGHSASVTCVAFSPDGSHVLSCSADRTISTWDVSDQDSSFAMAANNAGTVLSLILVESNKTNSTTFISKGDGQYFADWSLDRLGWILGTKGERLLWVPQDIQRTLWLPQTTGILNCNVSMKLDFKGAALGERWQECFDPTIETITYLENDAAVTNTLTEAMPGPVVETVLVAATESNRNLNLRKVHGLILHQLKDLFSLFVLSVVEFFHFLLSFVN